MVSSSAVIPPLPPYTRLLGPVTRTRLTRLALMYALMAASGVALAFWSHSASLGIFGLGLVMPGRGFLAHADLSTPGGLGHVAASAGSLGLFYFSLLVWFGTGNILAPPLTWLAAAGWAAFMQHGAMRPGALAMVAGGAGLAIAATAVLMSAWFYSARRQRSIDNLYLARAAPDSGAIFSAPAPAQLAEMSLQHVQRLRFALDRALQPVDEFNGFEQRDQFQTAATRYQLNFLAYGVALTQARYTPAFAGYMHEAQVALLDKQREHRVWRYWKLENMWGNLRSDPDPMARENIMFTGFVALQMALFSASTGRTDFSQPRRFTLVHPNGQRYAHDAGSLVASLQREFKLSAFYLIACEPNWVYPLCNTIGASAILAMDAQQGHTRWASHAGAFRHHLETEFLDGYGRYIACRSVRTGLPFPAAGGAMPLAMPCFFLSALAPDLARRQWLLLRRRLFDRTGAFRRRAFWPIDTGNYGFSRASAYAATALAAAELGDERVYAECMRAFEDECPTILKAGVAHRRRASVWAHGVELMALAGARDSFQTLVARPPARSGPRLEHAAYPDVLVALAHADARGLHLVLYPGREHGEHEIGIAGLAPATRYRVSGGGGAVATVLANGQGHARLTLALSGRTSVQIEAERDA